MRIAFFEIEGWEIPYLRRHLSGHELSFDENHLDEMSVKKYRNIEILSAFIYSPLPSSLLKHMPNLKLIVTRSTGFDHIDLEYCKKKNITVCNIPHYGANTVAEHTFALLLALSRKIVPSVERTRQGNFELDDLRGFDLHGKTIGVIGVGNIGTEVIRIAKGFGMHVVAHTLHPNEERAKKHKITFLKLPELLKISDIITLHVPYEKKTHHMINKKNIKKFKKGSILLNTARGGLIETEAILYGIDKGILKGAGLDVLENECSIKEELQLLSGKFKKECDLKTQLIDHILLTKENVLITPHNAFNSKEALHRILNVTVENILNFEDKKPRNTV